MIGETHRRHRAVEFRTFLDRLEASVPADLDVHHHGQLRDPQDAAHLGLVRQATDRRAVVIATAETLPHQPVPAPSEEVRILRATGANAPDSSVETSAGNGLRPRHDRGAARPDDGDWINWRRTLNDQGYSPLDEINRENVGNLQHVWSWAMQPGTDEVTPLVRAGVMYVPSRSGVQALDAATGDLI